MKGKVEISGAKNSALPCLAATLLSAETVILHNVPYVKDLITQRRLLEDLPALRSEKVIDEIGPDQDAGCNGENNQRFLHSLVLLDTFSMQPNEAGAA